MKNLFSLSFLAVTLSSCTPDKKIKSKECPEKWQLVKMTRNTAANQLIGADMDWQEWYLLNPDKTFTKTRNQDSRLIEENGTYSSFTLMDGKFLELVYPSDNELIGNCTGEPVETLILKSEKEMTSIWAACDGPGLFYEKEEYNCD